MGRFRARTTPRRSGPVRDRVASCWRKLPIEVDGRPSERDRKSGGTSTTTHATARITTINGVTPCLPSPAFDGSGLADVGGGWCRAPARNPRHLGECHRAPVGPRRYGSTTSRPLGATASVGLGAAVDPGRALCVGLPTVRAGSATRLLPQAQL